MNSNNLMRLAFPAALLALTLAACGVEQQAPRVKVFKGDGSVQCTHTGVSVEEMARELTNQGIDVACGQKGHDGLAQCQACGCGTGSINVYTIHSENLPHAESLGFAPVSDLPEYQDQPCT